MNLGIAFLQENNLQLVCQFSALTKSLNGIMKAEKFLWNEEIGRDFVKLKRAFTKGGIQTSPDFGVGDLFILTTDWSKENIAGVLSQVLYGQERFLGCWGRKCNKYERNYPSYKGELLAVMYKEVEAYIKLPPIQSTYRCLRLEVSHYHEESVKIIHEVVPGVSWFQLHCDTQEREGE